MIVPYPASNASVRARAMQWVDRWATEFGAGDDGSAPFIVGPGFDGRCRAEAMPTLLLRNIGRFSRGRAEQRLLRRGSPGVYDLDDGLPWDDGRLPGLGRWWKRPWPRSLVARRSAQAADRVVVGNDVLAEWAQEHCRDVRVVPTCVEPRDYVRKTDFAVPERPVLGWIGSAATEPYLSLVAPALREMHGRFGAVVEVVGSAGALPAELASFATKRPWSEQTAASVLATWDVGLMPLHDGVYERAKCGYKLLQYAAAGLPAVGSPVGVNRGILEAMDAPAPTTFDEWADALAQLLSEGSDVRRARAEAGFAVAEAYSYDVWESRWRAAVGLGEDRS